MKRLAARSFPEKMMLAAIILSCGFVMHAEQPAAKVKAKATTYSTAAYAKTHPATQHVKAKVANLPQQTPAW